MPEIELSTWLIATIFFVVAAAYSSVGLGGGSSYTALLLLLGFNTLSIPVVSLSLNLLVTSFASYYFIRHGHLRLSILLPFLISSIPMAWIGGMIIVDTIVFQLLLLLSLSVVIARIYVFTETSLHLNLTRNMRFMVSVIAGAILGLLAGILGIGGGVYLVPLILILGLGNMKEAAACGAVFVWINSLTGLVSRLNFNHIDLTDFVPILIAVLLGGLIGSMNGSRRISKSALEKVLGSILIVAVFFLTRSVMMA